MTIKAILTGDLVRSRKVRNRKRIMMELKDVLEQTKDIYKAEYDLFRGDSFQLLLNSPIDAVAAAILIRSKLRHSATFSEEEWDARISIGLGDVTYIGESIKDSDGVAFQLSGEGIKELEKTKRRLIIKAPWKRSDTHFGLITKFADNIISNWSSYSAEVAYYRLMYKESQVGLAKRMGKGQSTINTRISTAKLELIEEYIDYIKEIIMWGQEEWS